MRFWLTPCIVAVCWTYASAVNGGFDADPASAFVSSPTGQGALISDRVILTVGHVYPYGDGTNTYKTSGKIRDTFRNAVDAGEQSWTGTAIQHPKYDTCQQFEITMIILDTPLANLCAGANTPYALELPFDVTTGAATVPGYYGNGDGWYGECRSYGYGAYDTNRLHYATHTRINAGYIVQSADGCADWVRYIAFNKTRGNLCNGDSGGPNLCYYKNRFRLVSMSKGIQGGCDDAKQVVYGTDLNDPKIKQWIRDTLTQYNAMQSVIDAQKKCATVPMPIEGGPRVCEAGWYANGPYCYQKVQVYKTWADAQEYCKGNNANLASINDANEFNFALNLNNTLNSGWPSIWFGLNRPFGVWQYTDGTKYDVNTGYSNWATNYPEAYSSGNNCVAMYPYDSGRWATANCGWMADAFVCKK